MRGKVAKELRRLATSIATETEYQYDSKEVSPGRKRRAEWERRGIEVSAEYKETQIVLATGSARQIYQELKKVHYANN